MEKIDIETAKMEYLEMLTQSNACLLRLLRLILAQQKIDYSNKS